MRLRGTPMKQIKIVRFWLAIPVVLLVLLGPRYSLAASDTQSAFNLLANMSRALREADYRGLFTYEYGGALKTMRITHQVADGLEYEFLEHLNGPPLRVERGGVSTDCLSPADQVLRGLIPELGDNNQGLNQHYHFRFLDDERIAERTVRVLQVIPRDAYRYGYTLSIDRETSLPLASMTLNARNRALERLQFSSLELVPTDEWIELVNAETRVKRPQWPQCGNGDDAGQFAWQATWVPSGFLRAGQQTIEGVGEVVLYTDGLASFSVFVRPMNRSVTAQGRAQRGATVAYMKQLEFDSVPYTVTVVGEVPARTAQRVAYSVALLEAPVATVQAPADAAGHERADVDRDQGTAAGNDPLGEAAH